MSTLVHTYYSRMKTRVSQLLAGFWEASLSPVSPCLRTFLCNLLFSFLLGVFSASFFDDFRHGNVSPSEGKCLRRSVNYSTPALSVWKLPQVLQQQETYKWTLSFYRHEHSCFKFENNTSGRARLWDTAKIFGRGPFMTSPDHLELLRLKSYSCGQGLRVDVVQGNSNMALIIAGWACIYN